MCSQCIFQSNQADYGSAIMSSRNDDIPKRGVIVPGVPLALTLSGSTFNGACVAGGGGEEERQRRWSVAAEEAQLGPRQRS